MAAYVLPTVRTHCTAYTRSIYALQSLPLLPSPYAHRPSHQSPVPLRYPSMCFFKIDPEHAPIEPPGAAPTLVTLEEHYRAALAGEENGPKTALDGANPSVPKTLDANDKLEPNRPVSDGSAVAAGKRKMSVPLGTKVTMSPR